MVQERSSAARASRRAPRARTAQDEQSAALREVLVELATYPAMLTLVEARMFLRLTDFQMRRLIAKGKLRAFRQGKRFMVARGEVHRFVEAAA